MHTLETLHKIQICYNKRHRHNPVGKEWPLITPLSLKFYGKKSITDARLCAQLHKEGRLLMSICVKLNGKEMLDIGCVPLVSEKRGVTDTCLCLWDYYTTHLLFRVVILYHVDNFSNLKTNFIHILSGVLVGGTHTIQHTGWQTFRGGSCSVKF